MKNTIIAICVIIFISVGFLTTCESCDRRHGSGNRITVNHALENFSKLELKGNMDVILIQDDENKIEIEGDDNVVNEVNHKQEGDKVEIKFKEINFDDFDLNVRVYFKNIEELKSDLVGSLESEGYINSDYLKLSAKSVGNTRLNLKVGILEANTTSVGGVKLYGTADEFVLDNSSVGKVDCRNLLANHVKLENSSVGNTHVYADSTFIINHSGVGNLRYYGNGKIINQKINAVGSISKGSLEDDNN
jgi:hypothetical protein